MPCHDPEVTCSNRGEVGLVRRVPGATTCVRQAKAVEVDRAAGSGHPRMWGSVLTLTAALFLAPSCWAEGPFFVTYTAHMAEIGELEIAMKNVAGKPKGGDRFMGSVLEFEYGSTSWWTTEFYLDGQTTANQSTLFTGYRWENRFRPSPRSHWINPVFYFEFENLNEADKALLTVVGHDGVAELNEPASVTRHEKERELEAKLILDSSFKGWTLAENFIAEKNLQHGPYEFGYAVGIYRGLSNATRPGHCNFCRSNFQAGIEMYGGLGTNDSFGLQNTSHYLAPTVAWTLSRGVTFKLSPSFGLTDTSARVLLRFGVFAEVEEFGGMVKNLFR